MAMTCGDATMRRVARYGVSMVLGVPGIHRPGKGRPVLHAISATRPTVIVARDNDAHQLSEN